MYKTIAYIYGVVFFVLGILGFIPAFTHDGLFLNLFHVNAVNNVVYIITGVLGFLAASGFCKESCGWWTERAFFQVFGVVYTALALLGFGSGGAFPVLWVLANSIADSVGYIIASVIALYLGYVYKE